MADAPKVCTPKDPQGNGTLGRVYTQEVKAVDPDAEKRAAQQRAKAEACRKQPGVCAAMDLFSRVPWSSAKAGAQVGPAKVGVDSEKGLEGSIKPEPGKKIKVKPRFNGEVCIKPFGKEICLEFDFTSPIGVSF